jgi:uncharacterized membrane protein
MAKENVLKGEIVTTPQENPLGVAADLPGENAANESKSQGHKIRASEVVIIILLVLMVVCCCCVFIVAVGLIKAVMLALGGLFGGGILPTPFTY